MKEYVFGLGHVNAHIIGIVMKELVRRAIVSIRAQKQAFEVSAKLGYTGRMDDVLTSADKAAQEVYVRSLKECFPDWGIIAEEDELFKTCADTSGLYFTIDPLDGTKAFVRRQSHGVGTMISFFKREGEGGQFLAAYVGDVNTQEIYGFRPGSEKVHRITEFSTNETLSFQKRALCEQYVLLREPERFYSPLSRGIINTAFRNQLVDGGSIGTWLARLWKGEVGAVIIEPSMETPWDSNPVNAITLKMGFSFFKPSADGKRWESFSPKPIMQKVKRDHEILIVHESNRDEVLKMND